MQISEEKLNFIIYTLVFDQQWAKDLFFIHWRIHLVQKNYEENYYRINFNVN